MRMSRLVGIHRYEEESFDTYDYLNIDTLSGLSYQERIFINTPITDPNVKIQTKICQKYETDGFNIFVKHGNVEGGITEGLCTYHYYFRKIAFAALDNNNTPKTVGNDLVMNQWYAVTAQFGSQSVQITIDGVDYTATRTTEYTDMQGTWLLFATKFSTGHSELSIQDITFYDQTDTVLAHFIPCVKHPGRYIGMYDSVSDIFYPAYYNNQMLTTHDDFLSVGNLS